SRPRRRPAERRPGCRSARRRGTVHSHEGRSIAAQRASLRIPSAGIAPRLSEPWLQGRRAAATVGCPATVFGPEQRVVTSPRGCLDVVAGPRRDGARLRPVPPAGCLPALRFQTLLAPPPPPWCPTRPPD